VSWGTRQVRYLVLACIALGAFAATSAAASRAPLKWSSPSRIDSISPYAIPAAAQRISCPTATFCVSAGAIGSVKTSSNPTGPGSAWKVSLGVDQGRQLFSLSCPTTNLCAALDGRGEIITSKNPA
jgi:hypothetical protein